MRSCIFLCLKPCEVFEQGTNRRMAAVEEEVSSGQICDAPMMAMVAIAEGSNAKNKSLGWPFCSAEPPKNCYKSLQCLCLTSEDPLNRKCFDFFTLSFRWATKNGWSIHRLLQVAIVQTSRSPLTDPLSILFPSNARCSLAVSSPRGLGDWRMIGFPHLCKFLPSCSDSNWP